MADVKAELKLAFDAADVDKKGFLTLKQTKDCLEKILEFTLTDSLTKRIIKHTDTDGSKNINFEEFCTSAKDMVTALMELGREFRRVDTDMSGFLTSDEVSELLNRCGGRLSPDDHIVQDLIMSLDKDGDGRINFHEFLYFMADDICKRKK